MSQQFNNPINQKLAKNNKKIECKTINTEEDKTPIKTANRNPSKNLKNKENIGIMPFDSHQNNQYLNNSSSLRKISLLEKKSSRKDLSIDFFRKQLNHRRQKYENDLISIEEQFQRQISMKEQKLIDDMKKEDELDCDISILEFLQRQTEGLNQNNPDILKENNIQLRKLSLDCLLLLDREICEKVDQNQMSENQLTYTLETLTHHLKDSLRNRDSLLLDETLEHYFTSRY